MTKTRYFRDPNSLIGYYCELRKKRNSNSFGMQFSKHTAIICLRTIHFKAKKEDRCTNIFRTGTAPRASILRLRLWKSAGARLKVSIRRSKCQTLLSWCAYILIDRQSNQISRSNTALFFKRKTQPFLHATIQSSFEFSQAHP